MKRIYITLLVLLPFLVEAQLIKTHLIYFESNASAISSKHKKQLDSLIASLDNIPEAFYVVVKGHTDNAGNKEMNGKLSRNRAQTVLDFLKQKKFQAVPENMFYYDFSSPIAENNPENMWKNRRVEVLFYLRKIDMKQSLAITDADAKKYKFNEDSGGTIKYDSSKITIEANSFIHKNGSEVKGEIDITYREYRKPADFILSRIPMSVKKGNETLHFNSGGMFAIYAYQNGEELLLKKRDDKKITIQFPLENTIDQKFYQFDTTSHQWKDNAVTITDPHGKMFPPFNSAIGNNFRGGSSSDFLACAGSDTCGKAIYALNKLAYFITHEEPMRLDYPYKFILNEKVDFKSSYYKIEFDKEKKKFTIVPVNANNKLQKFTDYEWAYDTDKTAERLAWRCRNGVSFVKINLSRANKFDITIGDSTYKVTGAPKGNLPSESKLNKVIRKTNRSYVKYLKKMDKKTDLLEDEVSKAESKSKDGLVRYYKDSMECILYFYKTMVASDNDPPLNKVAEFNLNKKLLTKQLKEMPYPFTCNDVRRLVKKRDSLDRAILLLKNRSSGGKQAEFATFGISSTGIFNADAVKRMEDPEMILASYTNDKGEPLRIISVFLNLENLNGIIEYNGYMSYGPYKFVYGKKSKTMLIAVDEKMKSHYCSAEEFAAFTGSAIEGKVSFKLKPLENLGTTENLEKVMVR